MDSPVFETRTVRDFAEKSVTARFFEGCLYIPNARPLGESLGHLDSILDTLELRHPSLTHTCLEIAYLGVSEHPSALHQEFELCGTRETSSKHHRLVILGSCRSLDGLEKRISRSSSKEIVEEPRSRL